MANPIQEGDSVRLKSGGPKMRVDKIAKDISGRPTVWCAWVEGSKRHLATFDPDALEIVRR